MNSTSEEISDQTSLKDLIGKVINTKEIDANVFVIIKIKENVYEINKLNLENNYQSEILKQFRGSLENKFVNSTSLEIINISQYEKKDHQVLYKFDLTIKPIYVETITKFNPLHTKIPFFDISNINNIQGFIIVIGNDQNYLKIYQHKFVSNIIGRKSRMCITKLKDKFVVLEHDVISLESRIDLLVIADNVYIYNIKMLEKNFGFHELINKEVLRLINDKFGCLDFLDNADKLIKLVNESTSFARRLLRVIPISPIIKYQIPLSIIKEALNGYQGEVTGKLKYKDKEKNVLILKSNKDAEFFVDILEDKFDIPIISKLYKEKRSRNINDSSN